MKFKLQMNKAQIHRTVQSGWGVGGCVLILTTLLTPVLGWVLENLEVQHPVFSLVPGFIACGGVGALYYHLYRRSMPPFARTRALSVFVGAQLLVTLMLLITQTENVSIEQMVLVLIYLASAHALVGYVSFGLGGLLLGQFERVRSRK